VPAAQGKILVIRGGAIGDFILTLPVLIAFRERFPDVHRELLTYPRVAPLALAGGLVDRVQSIDARPMASFFARRGPLPAELAEYFESFALIVSYLFDPDRIFEENVARCSKAQFLVGPHRPDDRGGVHATNVFLKPLERLAIFDPDPIPRLDFIPCPTTNSHLVLDRGNSTAALAADGTPPGRWLALHPGSGSERKNWPEEKWRALLLGLISETDYRFLLVGGEAEGERLRRLASGLPAGRFKIAQSLPLADVAALLQQCWGYIGHDSGISHLAAAVGVNGLILWGETQAEVWRPRSDRFELLSCPTGLSELPVNTVLAAARAQFS
jgi:heptosyltransferase III